MRLGSIVIQFTTGAIVTFANAMMSETPGAILIHQVKQGHSETYEYLPVDIKAIVILPGDWLKGDVDKMEAALRSIK